MGAFSPLQKLSRVAAVARALPTVGGVASGLAGAVAVASLSRETLERLVWSSGVAALIPAAQPPLGHTARFLLALGAGVFVGAVVWAALFLLWGPGGFLAARTGRRDAARPAVRRADAHPDAPPRRPMTAADLGTPLMEVAPAPSRPPAEQPLPADLDQPLAAFDPDAVPAAPRAAVRAVPSLLSGERIETFELSPPPVPSVPPTRREPGTVPSIDVLLRRLEEGAARRGPRSASAA